MSAVPSRGRAASSGCALLILSCDAYQDLWEPCLTLYRRYWPDCPYPIFLVSEVTEARIPPAQSLRAGSHVPWSNMTRIALQTLEHEYVLLMLDDFFLTRSVDTRALEARRLQLEARQGVCLRLGPWPGPAAPAPRMPDIGEHVPGQPYRISLQPAFWRRSALVELLAPGESPWEFERNGSARADALTHGIYASRHALVPYIEVLTQGKWYRHGLRLCRREGLTVDQTRPVRSFWEGIRQTRRRWRQFLAGPRAYRLRRAIRRLVGG